MIQNVLKEIGGIGLYGIISVCLFFTVFSAALIWAFSLKKPFLMSMSVLPLEKEGESTGEKGEGRHE